MQQSLNFFIPLDVAKSVADDGDWVFEGIASTSDEDLYGEVVYPESFVNSIDFFKSNGKIYFNHAYAQKNDEWLKKHGFSQEDILSLKMPVGKPLDARITDEGLYIKAVLNKKHPLSSFIWKTFMDNPDFGDVMGLSIGAKYMGTPRREYSIAKGKYITYLPDLLLYEVSVTPEPVNPNTRTWASVMKGMIDGAEQTTDVSYHNIVPDEVIYDGQRDRLIVKSTVTGGSGKTHVFETYIDLKEDISYPMAKNEKVTLKATPGEEDEALLQGEAMGAQDEIAGDEAELQADEADLAADEAALGEEGGDEISDEAVDNILGSLVGDDAGEEAEEDEGQAMILDKLDAILDALQTLTAPAVEEAPMADLPGADQVDSAPPVIKSVELSDASTKKFGAALKGILEGWEDRVVSKIIDKLTNETTVVKSVIQSKSTKPIHPGIAVDSTKEADNDIVQKGVVQYPGTGESSVDLDAVKSLVKEYTEIIGHSTAHSQHRGKVIRRAEDTLGISQAQFHQYVKAYDQERKKN